MTRTRKVGPCRGVSSWVDFRKRQFKTSGYPDYGMSVNSIPTILKTTKKQKPQETIMDIQGGEPEWGSLVPVEYPSEARAVRVHNREVNQIWSNLRLLSQNPFGIS